MAVQNQHYVPKFILRNFLSNEAKEQVSVYDKHGDRTFTTAIRNIMAEKRFHDFIFDDWIVSFEPIASKIEHIILPRYSKIIETRHLQCTPEERADLSFLIAFQLIRTKAHREAKAHLENEIRKKVEASGGRMEQISGWEPLTEERLKMDHVTAIRDHIGEYAHIISQKDFLLADSAPGRSFYLGDNPVCLHNSNDFGPYGNLGLAVLGIEIYLPLASDLMLCAWCPSLAERSRKQLEEAKTKNQRDTLGLLLEGRVTAGQMKQMLDDLAPGYEPTENMHKALETGRPMSSNADNMDFYNSLQMGFAYRYVVSKHGDFKLAKKHNREFPQLRQGKRPTLA